MVLFNKTGSFKKKIISENQLHHIRVHVVLCGQKRAEGLALAIVPDVDLEKLLGPAWFVFSDAKKKNLLYVYFFLFLFYRI